MNSPRCGKVLLAAIILVPLVSSLTCNSGLPGIPGEPGQDGKDGNDGEKGEVGYPGEVDGWKKEEQKGDRGLPGSPGKVGPKGPVGPPGLPGMPGLKGLKGDSGDYKSSLKSAFSAQKVLSSPVRKDSPIRFDQVITNENGHYDQKSGKFTCDIPGIYYFTYHATSRGHLCVKIMKGQSQGQKIVTFCDQVVNTFQVTTGGVVVHVNKGEKIWLEPTEKNSMLGTEGADSIFTGFLLFPDSS
ncbi:hypothetical protein GDO86_017864 [Hymenochirus boettgeri]|uniref:C1q domain-containing protein n=1 Tax=Hymenochirus boettgeri TaxID=247094 RepID=A0A8T2IGW4_9PIPI|nr:hypothetical protein GDO86_017864 [Hymenochirus boettgeri]